MAAKRNNTMPAALAFEGVEIRIIDRQGRPWITLDDLAKALYEVKGGDKSVTPLRAIRRIFSKNEREFRADMTAMLTMETAGGPQQVRIFSPRGCHLMAMFAKTRRAAQFRRWVLDVLEGKTAIGGGTKDAVQLQINAMHAATRALDAIRRAAGVRAAALAAPGLYASFGINIDPNASDTLAQGELPLANADTVLH